jgi:inner membrane protein
LNPPATSILSAVSNFLKHRAIFFKMSGVVILILLLLAPLGMIHSVLRERLQRRNDAVAGITSVGGREQSIIGPVLIVPYRYSFKSWKEQPGVDGRIEQVEVMKTAVANAYFLPASLNITGDLKPKQLRRGIYRAVVYTGKLELSGQFAQPNFGNLGIEEQNVLWDDAMVTFAIPDLRGVKDTLQMQWGDDRIPLEPGCKLKGFSSGVYTHVTGLRENRGDIPLRLELTLNGSQGIRFTPVAAQNLVKLSSTWPDPSFQGAFLPSERQVSTTGFEATWQLSQYGRDYAQCWTDLNEANGLTLASADSSLFGVDLLSGIDSYRSVERAIKYGALFFVLVFAAFFLFEILSALRIHPFQYSLVGAALCLFYLGLLSLSEFIAFRAAYFAAAAATMLLIWYYCVAVLQSGRRTFIVVGMLAAIYGFLYVALQLQDYSLLLGTAGLFVMLAVVFYVTRNIDWYARDGIGVCK